MAFSVRALLPEEPAARSLQSCIPCTTAIAFAAASLPQVQTVLPLAPLPSHDVRMVLSAFPDSAEKDGAVLEHRGPASRQGDEGSTVSSQYVEFLISTGVRIHQIRDSSATGQDQATWRSPDVHRHDFALSHHRVISFPSSRSIRVCITFSSSLVHSLLSRSFVLLSAST
jgi:hypothetical protein